MAEVSPPSKKHKDDKPQEDPPREGGKPEDAKEAKLVLRGEGEALSPAVQQSLKDLLFGPEPDEKDVERWHSQGFTFSAKVPFGLTQLYGGPCGILAPIQAFLVKQLLYGNMKDIKVAKESDMPIRPTPEQATAALLETLAAMIDQAKSKQLIFVTMDSESRGLYQKTFKDKAELIKWLSGKMDMLRSKIGVLLFVYSVILSRGIETILADTDLTESGKPLVARFGHCTQEIVNLMLVGQAVTNVFNGSKDLAGLVMKGPPKQSDVGYLTLLESMAYSKVGENYKVPKFPIWVVGSSSHYTVLFALNPKVGQISEQKKKLQQLRALFTEYDPEENGFISLEQLGQLLKKVGDPRSVDDIKREVDPDNLGVCLWQNVQGVIKAASAPAKPEDWVCSVCTFHNAGKDASCEVCQQGKRPEPKKVAPPADDKEVDNFELYHYNGLDGHGGSVAEVRRVLVKLLGDGIYANQGSVRRGLREVICTRWPSAVVEYVGEKEPKIS